MMRVQISTISLDTRVLCASVTEGILWFVCDGLFILTTSALWFHNRLCMRAKFMSKANHFLVSKLYFEHSFRHIRTVNVIVAESSPQKSQTLFDCFALAKPKARLILKQIEARKEEGKKEGWRQGQIK